MKIIRIITDKLNSGEVVELLSSLGGGAVASFTGIARDDPGDRGRVTAIELEHYPAMTEPSLALIMEEAFARWSLLGGILVHRVGVISVGESIVCVGTCASHRSEALESCAFLIDRLKTDAPFWKKEFRTDGTADWVDAKASDLARAKNWRE